MNRITTLFMLLLSSFALSLHICIEYTIHLFKVNGNCLLYGQIFEMRRVFISRNRISCWWFLISEYLLVIVSTYHLWKYLRSSSYFQHHIDRVWKRCAICFVLSVLSTILLIGGFYSICNSLDVAPVCNSETVNNIEFKYFQPKYLDAYHFYSQYIRISVSGVLSSLCYLGQYIIFKSKVSS